MREKIKVSAGQVWTRSVPFYAWESGLDEGWHMGARTETDEGGGDVGIADGYGEGRLEVLEVMKSSELGNVAVIRRRFTDPDGRVVGKRNGHRIVRKIGSVGAQLGRRDRPWTLSVPHVSNGEAG